MDLLSPDNPLDLYSKDWQIYTRPNDLPPHYIASCAVTETSMISQGCCIYGTVRRSVLFPGVIVEKDAVVENSVVMSDCRICSGAQVKKAILCEQVTINCGSFVGNGIDIEIISPETQFRQETVVAG